MQKALFVKAPFLIRGILFVVINGIVKWQPPKQTTTPPYDGVCCGAGQVVKAPNYRSKSFPSSRLLDDNFRVGEHGLKFMF